MQSYPPIVEQKLAEIRKAGGERIVHDGQYTYILLALGERRTGGYQIKIVDCKETAQEIIFTAKEIRPDPGAMVIQVITYPTLVHKLPKTTKSITIKWTRY